MKNLEYIMVLFVSCTLYSCSTINNILNKNSKEDHGIEENLSQYDQLFNNKKVKTAKGLLTLHLIDNKVYMEISDSLLDKKLLMGVTVEQISDHQESYIGARPESPSVVSFHKSDSIIYLKKIPFRITNEGMRKGISNAIQQNSIGSIIASFPLKAQTPDNTASVVDVTSFFIGDLSEINPLPKDAYNDMGGWMKRTHLYKKEKSIVLDVMAFEDNFSVLSCLSYDITLSFLGIIPIVKDKNFSTNVSRSFMLLPDSLMETRKVDPRLGIMGSKQTEFSNITKGSNDVYYANRWRLEPKNKEEYISGNLSEPKKSILFFIDNKFPEEWITVIEHSIAQWNKAFERIGFKNAIQTQVFPEEDPTFTEGNIKYSYIRYITSLTEELKDNIWIDPRTGEIISANIYISHNVAPLLQRSRFIQTGASDRKVNSLVLDDEAFREALNQMLMKNIGHCLGLKDNMAASYAYPTDSLRSAIFTREHGLAASVMDDLPFNYIASARDVENGAALAQHEIGAYDYFAIKWLYDPLYFSNNDTERTQILQEWISENNNNAIYRYGITQDKKAFYDPRAMSLDLGNNSLESAEYAFKNLADVVKNADSWLNESDYDYSYRYELFNHILNQVYEYVKHVFLNVGGIYINEKYVGDSEPSYLPVPKELQRKSLKWILQEIENMNWLDNPALMKNTAPMGSFAEYCKKYFGNFVFTQIDALYLSESKSEDPYTQPEAMQDVMAFIWKDAKKGKQIDEWHKFMQSLFVQNLISWASFKDSKKSDLPALSSQLSLDFTNAISMNIDCCNFARKNNVSELTSYDLADRMGIDPLSSISYNTKIKRRHIWYKMLLETKKIIENSQRIASPEMKSHYSYLLYQINKEIKK